eukprot:130510-Prorocentrum_lima.AAC.1
MTGASRTARRCTPPRPTGTWAFSCTSGKLMGRMLLLGVPWRRCEQSGWSASGRLFRWPSGTA